MNNLEQNLLSFVSIGRDHWDVPVRVDLRAYLDFTRHINVQLRRLTERWESRAAPSTKQRFHRPNRPR
ncbi:MAG: hypothetical protein ABSA77_02460 [Thermoguttaceae bacterium]